MQYKNRLPDISRYVFGTLHIGRDPGRDRRVIESALDAGVWFHSSHLYGCVNSGNLLGAVFRENSHRLPRMICKISCVDAQEMRRDVEDTLSLLGLERIDIVQLSRKSGTRKDILVNDVRDRGPISETCGRLRQEGKAGSFIMELFCSCAEDGEAAVRAGMFDGYTFYYSLVQREVTNSLLDLLDTHAAPVISMKTAGSGYVDPERFRQTMQENPDRRDVQIYKRLQGLYENSGSHSWLDFTFRFLFSRPNIKAAVGGTTNENHLREFLEAAGSVRPLPEETVSQILAIQAEFMARI